MCTKLSDLKEIGQTILIPKLNSIKLISYTAVLKRKTNTKEKTR